MIASVVLQGPRSKIFFFGRGEGGWGRAGLKFESSFVTIVGLKKVFNRNVCLDFEYISWKILFPIFYLPNNELDISFSRFYIPMKIAHKDDS